MDFFAKEKAFVRKKSCRKIFVRLIKVLYICALKVQTVMSSPHYQFNKKTLKYERVRFSVWYYLRNIFGFVLMSVAAGFGFFLLYIYNFQSPNEKKLLSENAAVEAQYELLSHRMDEALDIMKAIEERDNNFYRVMLEADSIPHANRVGNYGAAGRYSRWDNMRAQQIVQETSRKMDQLAHMLYTQSRSFDELVQLAQQEEDKLVHMPAIMPVLNKDLKRTASGYGRRIDPIYKTVRFHHGMDFSAPTGTEIFVTGNGTIESIGWRQGYGNCIFVNHGLLRKNEFEDVLKDYEGLGLNVKGVDASEEFMAALAGESDPERKRKIIGGKFVEVFNAQASRIEGARWLAQGTIYPDRIESSNITGKVIKSHHNVGGLPKEMKLKLCEPLKWLFKDEVRAVGLSLGMPRHMVYRHPFPGPGLAVRILEDITPEKVRILQDVDDIFMRGLREYGLYDRIWQAGAILLPVRTVGVMGDERTYDRAVVLRAVTSTDAMTADWAELPTDFLRAVSNDIINNVKGVNRVCYDISSKPPATIEWE